MNVGSNVSKDMKCFVLPSHWCLYTNVEKYLISTLFFFLQQMKYFLKYTCMCFIHEADTCMFTSYNLILPYLKKKIDKVFFKWCTTSLGSFLLGSSFQITFYSSPNMCIREINLTLCVYWSDNGINNGLLQPT